MRNVMSIVFFVVLQTLVVAKNYQVTITTFGLRNTEGNIVITVYNREDDFLDNEKYLSRKVFPITRFNEQYALDSLEEGNYAISVFHDENIDGKLNQWFIVGPPKEGVGVSNNSGGFPSFKDAMFYLEKNIPDMIIKMKYIGND